MKEQPHLKLDRSNAEFERARSLVPGGVAGIRRPYNFVPGEYPVFFESGKAGHVKDVDGNEYIDYLCAYGPIILGYRETEVDEAVIAQIRDKGFCFSLTQTYQNQLAEKLRTLIPCSEMTVFVKTGSDATTCAIRIARSYTKRTKIIRCGYHGWHDWCVEGKGGIPKKLYEDVLEFHYNDLEGLEALLKEHGSDTAAIIVTPFGHPLAEPMQEPKPGFLQGVKDLAAKHGAVLVFDEIRTGFRMSLGGAQQYYGVTPDLAVFGKAMANGYSISCVTGCARVMREVEQNVFISSTFFPNSLPFIAALKTIEILEREKALDEVWRRGNMLIEGMRKAVAKHPVGALVSGVGPMMFITFERDEKKLYKDRRTMFYTQLIRRGVFLQPYHHGYVCYRHTDEDIARTIQAVDESLECVRSLG